MSPCPSLLPSPPFSLFCIFFSLWEGRGRRSYFKFLPLIYCKILGEMSDPETMKRNDEFFKQAHGVVLDLGYV